MHAVHCEAAYNCAGALQSHIMGWICVKWLRSHCRVNVKHGCQMALTRWLRK